MKETHTINDTPLTYWQEKAFGGIYLPETSECGYSYALSPSEDLIVDIIFWARNKNQGLRFSIDNQFYPGPHGKKTAKGIWVPNTSEACDSPCQTVYNSKTPDPKTGKYKMIWDPWAYRRHCKTREHISYLVKHRLRYLMCNEFSRDILPILAMVVKQGVLLHVNSDKPIVQHFVKDALAGVHWDTYKYFGELV
jgi:hypothetical protein